MRYCQKHLFIFALIVIAFVSHMLIVFPSGSYYCLQEKCGYFFWGSHGHDSIWHIALAANSFKKIPFILPIFADAGLSGYNIVLDLILFLFTKIGIPPLMGFFKIMPIVWFLFFTDASIRLARKICDKPLFVGLMIFFFFFGGSFGYWLTLYHSRTLDGSESLLAMQSGHMMLNLQFAFSLVVLLHILTILMDRSRYAIRKTFLFGLLIFLNFSMKLYAGVISLFLILSFYVRFYLRDQKLKSLIMAIFVFASAAIVSLILFYNPSVSLKNGGALVFSPFALVHSMIEEPNLFYLKNLTNARYFLQNAGFGPRLLAIELLSLLLYIFFNLGTRFFGLMYGIIITVKKRFADIDGLLLATIFFAVVLMTFFIQKGIWWNTVQFFYYAIFLANIFAAKLGFWLLAKKRPPSMLLALIMIILTIPIFFDFVKKFANFPAPAYLPQEEIEALRFLKKQPDGVVLTSVYDKTLASRFSEPRPLFAYADTAYVSAFSQKSTYLADQTQLVLLGIDYQKRLAEIKIWNCQTIKKVKYLYEVKYMKQAKYFPTCQKNLRRIFENQMVKIYQIL